MTKNLDKEGLSSIVDNYQLFYIDFAGTDDDGDSIVYSLAVPLDDHQPNDAGISALPDPTPPPHPIVDFKPGYTVNNMVPGNPSLSISSDGFITVKPTSIGLYVFSIKYEELIGNQKEEYIEKILKHYILQINSSLDLEVSSANFLS